MKHAHKLGAGIGALLLTGGIGAIAGLSQAAPVIATTPAALVKAVPSPATSADPGPDVQQGGNSQVGDQSAPDSPTANGSEKSEGAETPEKTGAETDGPGGHQDPPGSAGANTQQ